MYPVSSGMEGWETNKLLGQGHNYPDLQVERVSYGCPKSAASVHWMYAHSAVEKEVQNTSCTRW